ncbi:MAG: ABC transporter substrate-binding protein [Campylobacterota bacterium]|nr:ABC transporter substrate-binding protein [Campylobacterota bacterium]
MNLVLPILLLLTSFLYATEKKDTLEIGFVYYKKEKAPEKYNAYLYGINKAIEEINNDAKVFPKNCKLKLVPYNEKGKVEETIKIAKNIASRKNMISVIGFSNSKRAIPSIEYVSEQNIPIISSAGSRKIFNNDKNDVFFTTNFGIKGEMSYLKKFINSKGYDNFIFISQEKDKYSNEYYDELSKILKKNKQLFSKEIKDNLKEIQEYKTKNTLIVISVDVKENAKISKLLRDNYILNDIFLGRGGIVGGEFYEASGYGLKDIYELSTLLAGVSNETILKFKKDNKVFFKDEKNEKYLEYAAYGYDSVNLIAKGYLNSVITKTNNPKEIRETIKQGLSLITENNPYDGVTTTYSFDNNRIGGKLIPQYLLKSTGKKPSLYKKQYIYQNGVLVYVPSLFTNIDLKSVSINNQEATEYTIEMMVTLISEDNITLDDIEFENIVISDSSFTPAIYAKEFIPARSNINNDLKVKIYNLKALFSWDNSIENFPFDSQKLPILIKPKNPVDKNFINFFISDIDDNLNNLEISGWNIDGGYAGFKKGSYSYIDSNLDKKKEYYYRSSFTIDIKRSALSSAIKFILPLAIVLFITIVLFALPDNAAGDKVGSGTNMLITVAALYFTYATLVEVDYITFVDKLYMGSLMFVLVTNVIFILRQRFYQAEADDGGFNKPCFTGKFVSWIGGQKEGCIKVKVHNLIYMLTFLLSISAFIWAIIYFIQKANF